MRIGVISDTHGRLHAQAYNALADCDVIVHAGDIGDLAVLRELETLAPVTAVLGNCDYDEYGPRVQRFAKPVFEGVRFLVGHKPADVRLGVGIGAAAAIQSGEPLPHVCIHGHTHLPRIVAGKEASPASFIVCPGSASRPRDTWPRSVAFIEVEAGCVQSVRVESLSGEELLAWPR